MAVVALIPVWLYIGSRILLSPEGFWQELILGVVAAVILGSIQVVCIIVYVLMLVNVVWD